MTHHQIMIEKKKMHEIQDERMVMMMVLGAMTNTPVEIVRKFNQLKQETSVKDVFNVAISLKRK